jgi:hypothetical protein
MNDQLHASAAIISEERAPGTHIFGGRVQVKLVLNERQ